MGKTKENQNFESSFEQLRTCADALADPNVSLNDAISMYRAGIEHYKVCRKILDEAGQLIEQYDQESDSFQEIS